MFVSCVFLASSCAEVSTAISGSIANRVLRLATYELNTSRLWRPHRKQLRTNSWQSLISRRTMISLRARRIQFTGRSRLVSSSLVRNLLPLVAKPRKLVRNPLKQTTFHMKCIWENGLLKFVEIIPESDWVWLEINSPYLFVSFVYTHCFVKFCDSSRVSWKCNDIANKKVSIERSCLSRKCL